MATLGTNPDSDGFVLTPAQLRSRLLQNQDSGKAWSLAPSLQRRAAVLIPIVTHPSGLTMLLTRRTNHLHHHPGQISFPGGGMEAGDFSPEATALRESVEEIGLASDRVEVLGRLSIYQTVTGFDVYPVVGLVTPPLALTLDSFEVAEAFEVPLSFLLDARRYYEESVGYEGTVRRYFVIDYGVYRIWGATAAMLRMLAISLSR